MLTFNLSGTQLAYAIAICEGWQLINVVKDYNLTPSKSYLKVDKEGVHHIYTVEQFTIMYTGLLNKAGYKIIKEHCIDVVRGNPLIFADGSTEELYIASVGDIKTIHGTSYIEAGLRCYVNSMLGNEITIPNEI